MVLRIMMYIVLVGLAIGVRYADLDQPLSDVHHVRQSDTASIARNMVRQGIDLWHPRIDWVGPQPQTVESELPLYNALVALVWSPEQLNTPQAYRNARLINIGLWFCLVWVVAVFSHRRLPQGTPLVVCFMLFSPLGVVFSRTVQPDVLAVLLMMLSYERLDAALMMGTRRRLWVLTAAICLALGMAIKGTIVFFLVGLYLLPWSSCDRKDIIWSTACLVGVCLWTAMWYYYAYAYLGASGASFNIWGRGDEKWGGLAQWLAPQVWTKNVEVVLFCLLSPIGAFMMMGAFLGEGDKSFYPIWGGILGGVIAVVCVTEGFFHHEYYWLPMVPFASMVVAKGGVEIQRRVLRRYRFIAVLVTGGLVYSLQMGKAYVHDARTRDVRVEQIGVFIEQTVSANEAIVIVDRHPQSLMYHADRRGWCRSFIEEAELKAFLTDGATHIGVFSPVQEVRRSSWMTWLNQEKFEVYEHKHGYIIEIR